jgi:hypothetical protein
MPCAGVYSTFSFTLRADSQRSPCPFNFWVKRNSSMTSNPCISAARFLDKPNCRTSPCSEEGYIGKHSNSIGLRQIKFANLRQRQGVTVKVAALTALPPAVMTEIFPVMAPTGTVAITCVSEFTVKVAGIPPKVTFFV